MTTLTIKPHVNGPSKRGNRESMERMLYAYGYSEPNYPVPAIYDVGTCASDLDEWLDAWMHSELNLLMFALPI